jgi:hypothetical protein
MNRRTFIILELIAILMMNLSANAQKAKWATSDDPIAKELIAKEKMWAESNCSPQPGLKDVFAEEFQGTSPEGIRYGKADAMATDMNNLHRQCQLGEVKIQYYGETVAIAYGNESSIRKDKDGKEFKRCLVWTDTWLRREGKWEIITAVDVRVECPK